LNILELKIKFCTIFDQQFRGFRDECQLPVVHTVVKRCSERPTAAVIHDRNLL